MAVVTRRRSLLGGILGALLVAAVGAPAVAAPVTRWVDGDRRAGPAGCDWEAGLASMIELGSTCMPPKRARWASPAPRCQARCVKWSSARESPITPIIR